MDGLFLLTNTKLGRGKAVINEGIPYPEAVFYQPDRPDSAGDGTGFSPFRRVKNPVPETTQ
jgi:hypothetical protein